MAVSYTHLDVYKRQIGSIAPVCVCVCVCDGHGYIHVLFYFVNLRFPLTFFLTFRFAVNEQLMNMDSVCTSTNNAKKEKKTTIQPIRVYIEVYTNDSNYKAQRKINKHGSNS